MNNVFLARMDKLDPEWSKNLQGEGDGGIKQQSISAWKNGISKPSSKSLHIIAEKYHVTIGYLLGEENIGGFGCILDYFQEHWNNGNGFDHGIKFDESSPDPYNEKDKVWSMTIYSRRKFSDIRFIQNYLHQMDMIDDFPGDEDLKQSMRQLVREKAIHEARPLGEEE